MEELKHLFARGKKEWLAGRHADAVETYKSILERGGGKCGANTNAAAVLTSLGRHEEADKHFRDAFKACPDDKDLLFNYSLYLLSKGEIAEGFKLYENRSWNIRPPGKQWDGSDCGTILVVPEQGNGDLIQFARFLPQVRQRCRKMILMCFGPLVRLLGSLGCADEIIEFNPGDEFVETEGEGDENVPYDRFMRIMSAPHLLGTNKITPETYLKVDPATQKIWSQKVSGENFKVGICWKGGRRKKEDSAAIDSRRSLPFEAISPILQTEGAEFYSLQKESDDSDDRMIDLMGECRDFADTAAIINNLDLVITVDTAVAHVAGAMGKPTWVLNRKDSCWRWGPSGDSTVWYENMRLFRQKDMMDWGPVIRSVSDELRRTIDERSGTR